MEARGLSRIWPRSLQGQLLLAIALALLLAQGISAALLYSAQVDRRNDALIHTAAMRLMPVARRDEPVPSPDGPQRRHPGRGMGVQALGSFTVLPDDRRNTDGEAELRSWLAAQGIDAAEIIVVQRRVRDDPLAQRRLVQRERGGRKAEREGKLAPPERVMLAAVRPQGQPQWLVSRVLVPRAGFRPGLTLVSQTLLLYALLVGVIAVVLGRLTRPLQALTRRVEHFARTRDPDGQIEPQGPDDVRRLIVAHNAMEGRISSLLDEKDVMLGAIGHDLKTPLAALRVRIESVDDDAERERMAATIEDIVRTLDDILSLARVGRPSDPREPTDLSALIAQVADEFEDLGEPVTLAEGERIVVPLRPTWLRRAVRNLVSNAVRYGKAARIAVARRPDGIAITVEDDGPGIPDADIATMQEPFRRGDPSRNSATGGAGLGLALARAIAEQHGGRLDLANRRDATGAVAGLTATIVLPPA
ncbi:signal transduction histidine kinase [Novosphingobium kunmingense]|uniref:histidine kinase n=1 Tax=Novosphingobium kunmingense TaxID=1211806 RepID=A0A2N0H7D3_9SPHN|nr:ATP-binding protein [Novosphingobium kunmingense]PKB14852.1 signal transduction histidine kinase [Novosphingobium kunmingense]